MCPFEKKTILYYNFPQNHTVVDIFKIKLISFSKFKLYVKVYKIVSLIRLNTCFQLVKMYTKITLN